MELPVYKQRAKYVVTDFVTTSIAFLLFNIYRFYTIVSGNGHAILRNYLLSEKILLEQLLMPVILLCIYWLSGYYKHPFNKSRLQEFLTTFYSALFNSIFIFLILLINDRVVVRTTDYLVLITLFSLLFIFTYSGRLIITERANRFQRKNKPKLNTLIVGNSPYAHQICTQLLSTKTSIGYNIIGFIRIKGESESNEKYPVWNLDDIEAVCRDYSVDQIILAPHKEKDTLVLHMLDRLFHLQMPIKIFPDTLSYLTNSIRLTNILGEPLIDLTSPPLSDCASTIKRAFDFIFSFIALILLSPIMLLIAIVIRLTSKGPIIYSQERIGEQRKPFRIYKFRSMIVEAESTGPQLSSSSDIRITPFGHFMRKYRLDEFPQFWNVIKGDMSIVGPRPEREYYINRIVKKAPYYSLVFQVKPGITSWGMVKFGYASTISQMVERTKFDLLYINNMSIALDLKIMIYTIRTVVTGAGV